jgi:hypothetical protein
MGNQWPSLCSTRSAAQERIEVAMVTSDREIRCLSGPDLVSTLTLAATNRRYSRRLRSQRHRLHPYRGCCLCATGPQTIRERTSQDAYVHRPVRSCRCPLRRDLPVCAALAAPVTAARFDPTAYWQRQPATPTGSRGPFHPNQFGVSNPGPERRHPAALGPPRGGPWRGLASFGRPTNCIGLEASCSLV